MGKHAVGKMNENGELFAYFCSFNKLVIGGGGNTIFPPQEGTQGDMGLSW